MLFAALLVGFLACVNAHGGNFGNGGWNMGMGQMGMGQMGMGQMGMGQMGMGQMGMGQMGMNNQMGPINQLLQLLSGGRQNGGQGQMGGNMGGRHQMGGMGNQGMMGGIMLLLLQNMLQNRGNQGNNQMDKEEMEGAEELMKQKMMMEMADMMYVYMNFKEKEEEFKEAMEYMCFMVNATYEAYRRNGTEVFKETDDAMMTQLGRDVENMDSKEQMDFAIKMFNENMQRYSEIFLRFATWACMSGDAMMESYMKMEKMNRGEGHC